MNKTLIKYTSVGIIFGLCFPIGAYFFEYIRNGHMTSLYELHNNNPLLYMIDTAPLFLGIFAYIGGVNQKKAEDLIKTIQKQNDKVQSALTQSTSLSNSLKEVLNEVRSTSPLIVKNIEDSENVIEDLIHKLNTNKTLTHMTIDKVNSSICNSSSKINDSLSIVDTTYNNTLKFKDSIAFYMETLNSIKNIIMKSNSNIKDVNNYSNELKNITTLVKKLSKNMNLLSLNASIEASKSNEKGFSIIAKSMNHMSKDMDLATKDIDKLITTLQQKISTINSDTNYISDEIKQAGEMTLKTNVSVDILVNEINTLKLCIKDIYNEISSQSHNIHIIKEDSKNLEHVNSQIHDMIKDTKSPLESTLSILTELQNKII